MNEIITARKNDSKGDRASVKYNIKMTGDKVIPR